MYVVLDFSFDSIHHSLHSIRMIFELRGCDTKAVGRPQFSIRGACPFLWARQKFIDTKSIAAIVATRMRALPMKRLHDDIAFTAVPGGVRISLEVTLPLPEGPQPIGEAWLERRQRAVADISRGLQEMIPPLCFRHSKQCTQASADFPSENPH
jgi:hypothetical protein